MSKVSSTAFIYRNNNNISLLSQAEQHNRTLGDIFIMKIFPSKKNYRIYLPISINNLVRHYVWRTLKYAPPIYFKEKNEELSCSSKLCIHDIIKIGKLIFKINKIVIPDKNEDLNCKILDVKSECDRELETVKETVKENLQNNRENPVLQINVGQELNIKDQSKNEAKNRNNNAEEIIQTNEKREENGKQEILCRLCWDSENSKENPLISPCRCKGSMKFIHLLCLRKWFNKAGLAKIS